MPAILTHYTFALSALPQEDERFKDIVFLGSQGPDTFMACGAVPWRKRENGDKVRQWGHTMHAIPIGKVYLSMVEYARTSPDKDLLFAYLDGALMHYCVDRLFHPYIFYRSGFNKDGKLGGYWSFSHGFFEAVLDKTFAKKRKTYGRLARCIKSDPDRVAKISSMWAACSPAHLEEGDFYRSYVDFVSAEKMLYTPLGLKRPLFRLIGKYSTPWAQSHPFFMGKFRKIDVTNSSHSAWLDPCTGESHTESIDDLFEKALSDFEEVHAMLLRAKVGMDIREEFEAWTNNLNHDGEVIGMKKTHKKLCWEVLGKPHLLPPSE